MAEHRTLAAASQDEANELRAAIRRAWELLGDADEECRPAWQARGVLDPYVTHNGNGGAS